MQAEYRRCGNEITQTTPQRITKAFWDKIRSLDKTFAGFTELRSKEKAAEIAANLKRLRLRLRKKRQS
jgi:hypothetical protein